MPALPLALGVLAARSAPSPEPYAWPVAAEIVRFAERLAALGGDATVLGADTLITVARIKILALPSPPHANPYVQDERADAWRLLLEAAARGDRRSASEILRRYDIRYGVGDSTLSRLCGEGVAMLAPNGAPVVVFDERCGAR